MVRSNLSTTKRTFSQRQLRVGEELRHVLAQVILRGELNDPDLIGLPITVSEVRISPDLSNATVFVTQLGGGDSDKIITALTRAAPFLRYQVAKNVHLRKVPNLHFEHDSSFDYAEHIDNILQDVNYNNFLEVVDPNKSED